MIVTRRADGLCLVTQVEHGRITGVLAAHWGNASFTSPTPLESVVFAARHHDDGWRSRDARALLHEVERRPLHFLEIDPQEHVRLYQEGVERVRLGDLYAGLLVGMHWTGLYRGRWNRPGATGRLARDCSDEHLLDEAVEREEHRWVQEKPLAWAADEPRSVFEATLWHNYELLQLWDLLSLYLCVMPQDPVPSGGVPSLWGPAAVVAGAHPRIRTPADGAQRTLRHHRRTPGHRGRTRHRDCRSVAVPRPVPHRGDRADRRVGPGLRGRRGSISRHRQRSRRGAGVDASSRP